MDDIRLVMETVAELHRRGYGRLKLFCYCKEGQGSWRHWLFASDDFPSSVDDLPTTALHGSVPWLSKPTVKGQSPADAAVKFIADHPEIVSAAKGADMFYVRWYAAMLETYPTGTLEMQSPNVAWINDRKVITPYVNGFQFLQ
jgi:hypothetical protein